MSNPSDVIDEEEFEDSETDPTSPEKKALKAQQIAKINAEAAAITQKDNISKPENKAA